MSMTRWGLLGIGLALWVGTASAQPPRERQPGGGFAGRGIISAAEIEKLSLSAEQKEKVEKISKEYTDKQREMMRDVTPGGGGGGFQEIREKMTKLRTESEDKLKAVLNDDQKKKFEEIKKDRPTAGGGGFGGFPGAIGGVAPGTVLSDRIKERLELNADQKEQLEKLQKKVDEELKKILTDDQKKKLEDLRTAPPAGGRPGGARPGGEGGRPGAGRGERPQRPDR